MGQHSKFGEPDRGMGSEPFQTAFEGLDKMIHAPMGTIDLESSVRVWWREEAMKFSKIKYDISSNIRWQHLACLT